MRLFYLNFGQMAKLLRISEAGNFMGSKWWFRKDIEEL
jgi:hypothetical protein